MRFLFAFCVVLTVLQILNLSINGVSAEGETTTVVREVSSKSRTSRTETTTDNGYSGPSVTARALMPRAPVPRALVPRKVTRKPSPPPPSPASDEGDFESEQRPSEPVDAVKNLARTTANELKGRATDLVNGAAGTVKTIGRTAGAVGRLVGKQRKNVERLAVDGVGLVSEAGDGLTRGARHSMNSAKEIAKDGVDAAHGTLRAATGLTRSSSKLLGAAFTAPFSIAGHWTGTGTHALGVPVRLSRKLSGTINRRVFGANDNDDDDDV